jgi:WD40 repeat protein
VSYSPDGTLILTTGEDGSSHIWDAGTGEDRAVLQSLNGSVSYGRFSPDGQTIATALFGGGTQLWDAHLESRPPKEVERLVDDRVGYRVDEGKLVPVDESPTSAP